MESFNMRKTSRRTHTKSRNGCTLCKARKVKCDENKPKCNNCIKHGIECDFDQAKVPTGTWTTKSATSSPSAEISGLNLRASPSVTADASPASDLMISGYGRGPIGMAEMELLHHYTTSTCYTISRLPVLQTVWRITVPKLAFASPFLMHGILSLSALHLAYLKPDHPADYVAQAEFHHNLALQMVSTILPRIDEDNATPVYIFSTITSMISCAKPRLPDDFWVIGDRDIEWMSLFRGTRFIIATAEQSIKFGPISPILTNGNRRSRARNARSTSDLSYLDDLRDLLRNHVTQANELECYYGAIDDLSKSFATVEEEGSQNCQTADVFVWLLQISDEYLHLLRQRKPEALVIFSYFCVLTHELEWMWWMRGLSVHLIRGIYYFLSEEYRCWLQWPMEQLGWVP